MAEHTIPVDLYNPGQVFACLGFLEAVDALLGDAEGGFDWSDEANVTFILRSKGQENPINTVLEFLAMAEIKRFGPVGYFDPPTRKAKTDESDEEVGTEDDDEAQPAPEVYQPTVELTEMFPAGEGDRTALPICLVAGSHPAVKLGHWADGSTRNSFKLYSGNRSADQIARAMLKGVRKKLSKKQNKTGAIADFNIIGVAQLWEKDSAALVKDPFGVLTPMGGSFNFDPRGAWTAIDAGYSPNDQSPKHLVEASPVVEFLAAWGLENARPDEFETRKVRYAAWGVPLSPMLARAALCGSLVVVPLRHFHFELHLSGKNKVVTFAEMETRQ